MTIYLEIFNGVVIGWGSQMDNAPSVTIDESDSFFTNFREVEYIFDNGELRLK